MSGQTHATNYLLTISRLPERFFALVTGRESVYENPGVAVRSFVIAHALHKELVHCEGQLLESIFECTTFSTDKKILEQIMTSLMASATALVTEINGDADRPFSRSMIGEIAELHEQGSLVKMSYDALMSIQQPDLPLTIDNLPGMTFRNALFEMQDKIGDITCQIEAHKNPSTKTRA